MVRSFSNGLRNRLVKGNYKQSQSLTCRKIPFTKVQIILKTMVRYYLQELKTKEEPAEKNPETLVENIKCRIKQTEKIDEYLK